MFISVDPAPQSLDSATAGVSARTKAPTVEQSEKSAKARAAVEKFEGLFMSMIIKQLRETSFGEGLFPNDSSDTYGGMFDMFMGDHLAKSADLGIERLFRSSAAMKQLEEHVSRELTSEWRSKGIEEYRNEQFRTGAIPTS